MRPFASVWESLKSFLFTFMGPYLAILLGFVFTAITWTYPGFARLGRCCCAATIVRIDMIERMADHPPWLSKSQARTAQMASFCSNKECQIDPLCEGNHTWLKSLVKESNGLHAPPLWLKNSKGWNHFDVSHQEAVCDLVGRKLTCTGRWPCESDQANNWFERCLSVCRGES